MCHLVNRMSNKQLRIHNTDIDNLISNLRGEVGDIVFSWIVMQKFIHQSRGLQTDNIDEDLKNPQLILANSLIDKLENEIISRLSELADEKIGRLTFHFAQKKLGVLNDETTNFISFMEKEKFRKKRNLNISHKELPEQWTDHKSINISYRTIVIGIVMAIRLIKKFDRHHLGPKSKYLWQEMRRRRYKLTFPAKIGYILMPYIWLPNEVRKEIIIDEIKAGMHVWEDMSVSINGMDKDIKAYGKMGALLIDGHMMILDSSFIELESINFPKK